MVPFAATPMPKVSWAKGELKLREKEARSTIDSNDFLSTLVIEKCELGDSGVYFIEVSPVYIWETAL